MRSAVDRAFGPPVAEDVPTALPAWMMQAAMASLSAAGEGYEDSDDEIRADGSDLTEMLHLLDQRAVNYWLHRLEQYAWRVVIDPFSHRRGAQDKPPDLSRRTFELVGGGGSDLQRIVKKSAGCPPDGLQSRISLMGLRVLLPIALASEKRDSRELDRLPVGTVVNDDDRERVLGRLEGEA